MPELNPLRPGLYVAGNAGDGGVVSTNDRRIVLGPSAGNAHWYQATEAVCQCYGPGVAPRLVAVDVLSGNQRDLWLDGVNKIVAGSGHWFAVTMRTGILLDGLPITPGMNVRAFAGDYMAWFPWNGTGLTIRHLPSGTDRHLSDVLDPGGIVQLFPDGGVIWGEAGEIRSDGVSGLPSHIPVIPGGFGWQKAYRIGGVWWVTYQSYALASVVAHPVGEFTGYRWPAPLAYFLDAGLLDQSRPRIVWSRGPAEAPSEIEVHDVDLSQPRVNLTVPISGTPIPIPGPIPVPVPEPPKMRTIPTPARAVAIVQALYERHKDLAQGSDDDRRALMWLIAQQQRFELGSGWGTKRAGEGRPLTKDAIAFFDGATLFVADAFNGSTRQPSVAGVMDESEGQIFVEVPATDLLGVGQPAPNPEPTPTPTPVPSHGNEDQLLIWMVDIERRLSKLEAWTRGV